MSGGAKLDAMLGEGRSFPSLDDAREEIEVWRFIAISAHDHHEICEVGERREAIEKGEG